MSIFFDVIQFRKSVSCNTSKSNDVFSKRIICFDYGTHKIGFAVSDEEYNFAFPKDVIIGQWIDINEAFNAMKQVCENNKIKFIVFGFPKKPDNTLSENCEKILQIAEKFDKDNYQILLFDERFSTKASTAVFRSKKNNFGHKKNHVKNQPKYDDAMAASVILNDVLQIFATNDQSKSSLSYQ